MANDLVTYLNDHHAGAEAAIEMMDHLRDQHEGTPAAAFLGDLRLAVESDRLTLVDLMGQLDVPEQRTKQLLGAIGEKFSRIKLGVHASGEELSLLMGLDTLTSGVAGKRALWEALQALAATDARLADVNFDELLQRADTQMKGIAAQRRTIGAAALHDRSGDATPVAGDRS